MAVAVVVADAEEAVAALLAMIVTARQALRMFLIVLVSLLVVCLTVKQ